jgi:hypothetical protein
MITTMLFMASMGELGQRMIVRRLSADVKTGTVHHDMNVVHARYAHAAIAQ